LTLDKALAEVDAPAEPSAASLTAWVLVLLILFATAIVRIRLLDLPLERDEGEYAFVGQLLLHGIPPYQEAFNMKFPGVYGAYAVIMAIFGQTVSGIHLGLLFLNAGTIVLVFLLGRRLFGNASGVASAAAYALLSLGFGVLGMQAHATHFVVAAALGATLLLLQAIDTGNAAKLFWSGVLYGVAILMKQPGACFALFGCLYLVWSNRPPRLRKFALFFGGLAVPLALTALALWRAGVFDKFWFWTIKYARQYSAETSLAEGLEYFKFIIPYVAGANVLLWILAGAGLVMLWRRDRVQAIFISAFLLFSFAAVSAGLWFRGHYFILMLPAIALLAGSVVSSTRRMTWWLFGAVLVFSLARQGDLPLNASPIEASRAIDGFSPFPEAIEIANYIRTHSEPAARIAVLGSEPEIYFYADRRSATGFIYTYGLMEAQPFAVTMQNEMIQQIESARPEYVVFISIQPSWGNRPDSPHQISDWWTIYSAREYLLAGVIDMIAPDRSEYHWSDAATYRPQPKQFILVYKRKNP
jgi:hypothetical protein